MKDYVFSKPVPFVTEDSENSTNTTYKNLSRGLGVVFGNDQRNIVFFALGLGVPTILVSFVAMLMIAWGNPILMIMDMLLFGFICWVAYAMYDIYNRTNKTLSRNYESKRNDKPADAGSQEA